MIIHRIINFVLGYVNIRVEGLFIERFINMCNNKSIFLWNLKREKATLLYASINPKEFKNIVKITKKTGNKIKITQKKGLPFIVHKYRKRKVFIYFAITIMLGITILSRFVWNIEIIGANKIDKEEIQKILNESGLTIGTLKKKINTDEVINKVRLETDKVAWVGIAIHGTNVVVEIKERTGAPKVVDENEYCNIISEKEGIITKINVHNGTANVKVGEVVRKGTVLVNGFIEGKYTGSRNVHASADIEARVWYSKKQEEGLTQTAVRKTGNKENKYAIKIGNFNINLNKTLSKFENYDTIEENKKIKLFSNFYLPIEFNKTVNEEYISEEVLYTEEQLVEKITTNLEKEIMQDVPEEGNIVNKQVNVYKTETGVKVEVILEVIQKIGIEDKINT